MGLFDWFKRGKRKPAKVKQEVKKEVVKGSRKERKAKSRGKA